MRIINVRTICELLIIVLLASLLAFYLCAVFHDKDFNYGSSFLAIAGFIVGIAALSQVAYALVAFIQSREISHQVASAKGDLDKLRSDILAQGSALKDSTYSLGLSLLQVHLASHYLIVDLVERKVMYTKIKEAEIELHINRSTYSSLMAALQEAYKLDPTLLDKIEAHLKELKSALPVEELCKLRVQCATLKRVCC